MKLLILLLVLCQLTLSFGLGFPMRKIGKEIGTGSNQK